MEKSDLELSEQINKIAKNAGDILLKYYKTNLEITEKEGAMPVTVADEEANDYIVQELKQLTPEIPIVAEEDVAKGIIPDVNHQFWLVDPLDGTKEFINQNQDFTVNIALIRNRKPVVSVVYVPALQESYFAQNSTQAYYQKNGEEPKKINVRKRPEKGMVIVTSRSHRGTEINQFLEQFSDFSETSRGSSLKFCIVATGEADLYPRFGRTMEWDTAAGHGVVLAAGGEVLDLDGNELIYGKNEFANPFFIVSGKH